MLRDNLVAKNLRQKCMNEDLRKMIENIESLNIIQETMEVCYEKLEKYVHSGGSEARGCVPEKQGRISTC